MRLELTRVGLLVELANHYTTRGAHLFDGVNFQDAKVFVRFLFSEGSNLVLIWQFQSVCQVSFAAFHY